MTKNFHIQISPRTIPVHDVIIGAETQDAALIAAVAAFGTSEDFRVVSCEVVPEEQISVPPIEGPAEPE